MPYKPFRPPLIRKPPPDPTGGTSNKDGSDPPAKRRRIRGGDDNTENDDALSSPEVEVPSETSSNTVKPQSMFKKAQQGYRAPLIQKKNTPLRNGMEEEQKSASQEQSNDSGADGYYNALWRKFTAKKHKTWDGDGIVIVRGGYAYLQDVSGRELGRVMVNTVLAAGSSLSIGGKDVEIESELSRKEYLSGRPQGSGGSTQSTQSAKSANPTKRMISVSLPKPSLATKTRGLSGSMKETKAQNRATKEDSKKTLNAAAPKSLAMSTAFKNPLKDSTVLAQKAKGEPVPRHDPISPNALIMRRPSFVPKGKQVVDVVVDPLLTKHLREHQREGVKFLYECVMGMRSFNGEGAILADEMGLGKTLQTIALLWTLLKQNPIHEAPPVVKKALIVCPVTLIKNWRQEFRKWLGNERIGVFVADDKKTRLTDFTRGRSYSVMIIGYERLRNVQEELIKGSGVDIVIADEGHRLKTVQNKSAQAIMSLNTARRIVLSGTTIQNNLGEFFAVADFVNPGVLGTYKMFMKEFEAPIDRGRQPGATKKEIEKGEDRNEELIELTSQFMLRRTADILAKYLPPKTEYILFCKPTAAQANIYRHVLASPMFQSALGTSESALHLITILKKLCNSPSLLNAKKTDETPSATMSALLSSLPPNLLRHFSPASSGKIRVLDQLLHRLSTKTSEKIVLVSNYTSTLNLLATLLTSLSLPFLRLDGSTPASKRQSLVDDFNRTPASSCFAFLLSAKAGGMGLNLIGASRLVLFDVDWNPATDMQAMARIHRDGQKRPCRIYRILLKGGLEEKIWQRQVTKIGLADSVMEAKGDSMSQFSKEELKDLFRLDEGEECQTHALLGCDCDGRGHPVEDGSSTENQVEEDGDEKAAHGDDGSDGDSDDSEDFPDLPTLLKASEVDMEEQERLIQRARTRLQGKGRKQEKKGMQSLMRYTHIDASHLSAHKPPQTQIDGDDEALNRDGENDLEAAIDDDVLCSVLKDEGNRISFVFKKTGFAPADAFSPIPTAGASPTS